MERSADGQGRLPDFFIVGHAKSGTTALYAMLSQHPQIVHAELKEPWFFADELRERDTAAPGRHAENARRVPRAVRRAARRAARRRGLARLSVVARRPRGAIAAGRSPTRGSSRSCASPRASCARCTCSCLRDLRGDRERLSQGDRSSRRSAAQGGRSRATRTGRRRCSTPTTSRYVEQLRRYEDALPPRADARADLRRLPRRQRGDGAPGAALPRRRRRRADRGPGVEPQRGGALAAPARGDARA